MLDDCLAEGLSLTGIIARSLERCLCHADSLGGNPDPATFKSGERDAIALAFLSKSEFRRYAHFVESDLAGVRCTEAELFLDTDHLITWRIGRDDEGGDALLAGVRISYGEDDDHLPVLARGDELFRAVDDVMVAITPRARLQVDASKPACGSVSAKLPIHSPGARRGRKRSFCSSLPNLRSARICRFALTVRLLS